MVVPWPPPGLWPATQERHVLAAEMYEFVVEVNGDGSVGLSFANFGSEPLILSAEDLGRVVSFAEQHGQITVVERDQ